MSAAAPALPDLCGREMVALAFRRRRAMLSALLFWPAVAVALILLLPPKYRAQCDILVKTGREYLAEADAANGVTAPTSTKQEGINSEISLLTGRAVIEATINELGIENLYPSLLESPPWFGSVMDAAVDKFSKDLDAEPIKLSTMVAVSYNSASPAKAKLVLEKLVRIYIDKHAQVFAGGNAPSYADAIRRSTAEFERLERERTTLKLQAGIYDVAAQRAALISQRVAAESHLQDVVNNRAMLEGRLRYLLGKAPHIPSTVRSTGTDRNAATDHARQTLIDLRAAEAAMSARYAPGNPDLVRVREQIAALQPNARGADRVNVTQAPNPLLGQVDGEIVLGEAQVAPLAAERERTERLIADLSAELGRIERADLDLRTLGARIEAVGDDLKLTQARYDQARTQEEMDRERQVSVVMVAPPIAADRPAKPKKTLFLLAGVLLGLLSAGGIGVLAAITGNTVATEDGLERLLGLPVLLALPAVRPGRRQPVTLRVE